MPNFHRFVITAVIWAIRGKNLCPRDGGGGQNNRIRTIPAHCSHYPSVLVFGSMEERDFSLARQELVKREGQAHGAILEMLRKFDEQPVPAVPAAGIRGERVTDETPPPVPRK